MPRHLAAILAGWNTILNNSKVSNEEAVWVVEMMLGFVIINTTADATNVGPETEQAAHELVEEAIDDIHAFISENYQLIIESRRTVQ